MAKGRSVYQAAYRNELEDEDNPNSPPVDHDDTTGNAGLSAEEVTFKKRYGDLRSHSNVLTQRISQLEDQLRAANRKEVQIPSSPDQLKDFMNRYPDVYRDIRSIVLTELVQEKESLLGDTKAVKLDLDNLKREAGLTKILNAHPDFHEVNLSDEFKEWVMVQPKQIQDWLFESDDPILCIKGLDLYKHEKGIKRVKSPSRTSNSGADTLVRTRSTVDPPSGQKKIWKESEIARMNPKQYEQLEDEIDLARSEGRFELGV